MMSTMTPTTTRQQQYHQHHPINNNSITATLPSQIAFVPDAPNSDLYGAVNCRWCTSPAADAAVAVVDGSSSTSSSSNANNGGDIDIGGSISTKSCTSSLRSSVKLGPPLLEIRRLKYSLGLPTRRRHCSPNNHAVEFGSHRLDAGTMERNRAQFQSMTIASSSSSSSSSSSLVHHETVLISRGLPGLGGNIASTCLDFRPSNNYCGNTIDDGIGSEEEVVVRCATGLTSGALCVHSLSNLYSSSDNNHSQPSSTVAHYAPRQQRPATSVAWRPSSGGGGGNNAGHLVAVGLVGSGNYGVFSSSSSSSNSIIGEEEVVANSNKQQQQTVLGSSGGSIYSTTRKTTLASHMGGVIGMSSSSTMISSQQQQQPSPIVGSTRFQSTAMGGGGGGGGGGSGGDRDFGVLVWDIEAQSSVVGGAGTLVGGGGGGKKGISSASVGSVGKGGMMASSAVPIKSESFCRVFDCRYHTNSHGILVFQLNSTQLNCN